MRCSFCCGIMVEICMEAAEMLAKDNIDVAVVNLHTIKPIDRDLILRYAKQCKKIVYRRRAQCDWRFGAMR